MRSCLDLIVVGASVEPGETPMWTSLVIRNKIARASKLRADPERVQLRNRDVRRSLGGILTYLNSDANSAASSIQPEVHGSLPGCSMVGTSVVISQHKNPHICFAVSSNRSVILDLMLKVEVVSESLDDGKTLRG
jgi:hypothetical protein